MEVGFAPVAAELPASTAQPELQPESPAVQPDPEPAARDPDAEAADAHLLDSTTSGVPGAQSAGTPSAALATEGDDERPPDKEHAYIKLLVNDVVEATFERPFTRDSLRIPEEKMARLSQLRDFNVKVNLDATFEWERIKHVLPPDEEDLRDGYRTSNERRLELLAHNFEHLLYQSRQVYRAHEIRRLLEEARRSEIGYLQSVDPTKVPVDDLERLLQHDVFFSRIREAVYSGTPYRMTVYFKDLTLVASEKNPVTVHPALRSSKNTVWTNTVTLLCGPCLKLLGKGKALASKVPLKLERPILDRCSGILRPGRLTLVLGPPGAGKTTLMRTLMGLIKSKEGKQTVTGGIYYNQHNVEDLHPPNFAAYVDQIDDHIPVLTTEETFQFAFDCKKRDVSTVPDSAQLSAEQIKHLQQILEQRVNFTLGMLGLTRAAQTIIGNDVMKGVSGGEKRRVTLGEMLVAGANNVLFLDEISTGLDSAATFDITKALLSATRLMSSTIAVALLQPPPETYDLFDDILLIDSGRIVYLGPREDIVPHFEALGFERPPGKDIADWLQEVTTKDGPKYRKAGIASLPSSTEEFVTAFRETKMGQAMMDELEQEPQGWAVEHWNDISATSKEKYANSWWRSLRLILKRQATVVWRNKPFLVARVVQNLLMGLLLGALMWDLSFDDWFLKAMLMFQYLAFNSFSAVAQLGEVMQSRNVYYKQSKMSFYPVSAYVVADMLVAAPMNLFDVFCFGTLIYFMCGLTTVNGGAHYFNFLFIGFSYAIAMGQVVRAIGYISPNQNSATSCVVTIVVVFMFFSGGIATFDVIPDYWIWLYWMSPMSWTYRSFQQNEYLSDDYTQGFQCCTGPTGGPECQCDPCVSYGQNELNCGEYFLKSRQFQTESWYLWVGIAISWAYIVIFVGLSILALRYVRYDEQHEGLPVQGKPGDGDADDLLEKLFGGVRQLASPGLTGSNKKSTDTDLSQQAAMPFEPCELVFRDVTYTLLLPGAPDEHGKTTTHPVELLKGVSGFAKPYKMTALMGSSGAGKTTLLDVLADRKTQGEIKGDFLVNGKRKEKDTFVKQMGYVEQFGSHCPTATVLESLVFSAELRLGSTVTRTQRMDLVNEQMELLELNPIKDKTVGTIENGGLSFEEMKRLTIGVELASNPAILFLDEPTSGLDARGALIVMGGMQKVAANGRSIVCTIHQPSLAVFSMFDDLLLMRRGGEVVFFGELGENSANLVKYFESYPGVPKCPEGLNPATWMLDVIGAGTGGGAKQTSDFAAEYKLSALYAEAAQYIGLKVAAMPVGEITLDDKGKAVKRKREEAYTRNAGMQIKYVLERTLQEYWRTPSFTFMRIAVSCLFAIILGSLFWQIETSVAADVQSVVSLLNTFIMIIGMYNANTMVPFMYSRKALYYREKASNLYRPSVFALCAGLAEIPYNALQSSLSVNILYWMVGLQSDVGLFFYFWLLNFLWFNAMSFLGMVMTFLLPNQGVATLIMVLYVQTLSLFAGTLVPGALMPNWLLWLSYISPMRWGSEGVIVTQFESNDSPICVPLGEIVSPGMCTDNGAYTTAGEYVLGDPTAEPGEPGYPGLYGGPNGYRYDWRWYDILFIGAYWLLVWGVSILSAERISYEKR